MDPLRDMVSKTGTRPNTIALECNNSIYHACNCKFMPEDGTCGFQWTFFFLGLLRQAAKVLRNPYSDHSIEIDLKPFSNTFLRGFKKDASSPKNCWSLKCILGWLPLVDVVFVKTFYNGNVSFQRSASYLLTELHASNRIRSTQDKWGWNQLRDDITIRTPYSCSLWTVCSEMHHPKVSSKNLGRHVDMKSQKWCNKQQLLEISWGLVQVFHAP